MKAVDRDRVVGLGWLAVVLACLLVGVSIFDARASEVSEIRILSTNDIHTYLRPVYYRYLDMPRPWGTQTSEGDYEEKAALEGRMGGMAYVATVIKQLRDEKPDATLVVDAVRLVKRTLVGQ